MYFCLMVSEVYSTVLWSSCFGAVAWQSIAQWGAPERTKLPPNGGQEARSKREGLRSCYPLDRLRLNDFISFS